MDLAGARGLLFRLIENRHRGIGHSAGGAFRYRAAGARIDWGAFAVAGLRGHFRRDLLSQTRQLATPLAALSLGDRGRGRWLFCAGPDQ